MKLYHYLIIILLLFLIGSVYVFYTKYKPEPTIITKVVYKDTPIVDSAKQAIKPIEKRIVVYKDRWNFIHDTLIQEKKDTIYILADDFINAQDSIIVLKDIIINDLEKTLALTRDSLGNAYLLIEDQKTKKRFWQKISAGVLALNVIQILGK